MKTIMKYALLFFPFAVHGQTGNELAKLYVNKSTGEYSTFSGTFSKTTDNYETGQYTVSSDGPIIVSVTPSLNISTNESKTWTGTVMPDMSKAPSKGMSETAHIYYSGSITYSRPATGITTDSQAIDRVYTCPKCPVHENGGSHEIITEKSSGMFVVMVQAVDVYIGGPKNVFEGSTPELAATGSDPEKGTYTWESLTPALLEVKGDGAKGKVTCKPQKTGKGKIAVAYVVDNVRTTDTFELTVFKLKVILSETRICDGTGVSVKLQPVPAIDPVGKVQECISNLEIKYKPVLATTGAGKSKADIPAMNIVNHTNINFSQVDDKLTSKADTVYWFISDKNINACKYVCNYRIWAEADNNYDDKKIATASQSLDVSVDFGKCVNGTSHILLDVPDINSLLYFVDTTARKANTIVFLPPKGFFPDLVINLVPAGVLKTGQGNIQLYSLKGVFTVGNFSFSKQVETNITNPASQFYPLVVFEEGYHTKQFAGDTKIPELKGLFSASETVARANANITVSKGSYSLPIPAQAVNEHVIYCKQMLLASMGVEIAEYLNLAATKGKLLRCLLEQEAKAALAKKFGNLFTVGMACGYDWCFDEGYLPKPGK